MAKKKKAAKTKVKSARRSHRVPNFTAGCKKKHKK
jgi:hypothetical protein